MNFSFRFIIFITTATLLFSCAPSSKTNTELSKQEHVFDSIMTQVIAVHDEVMPKMGEVNTLIKELGTKIDTTAQGIAYGKAQDDLKNGHDGMMNWMGEFSDAFQPTDAPETNLDSLKLKMTRLKTEEIKIQKVKTAINTGIANAKQLINAAKDSVQ